jgi:hypothetical protein
MAANAAARDPGEVRLAFLKRIQKASADKFAELKDVWFRHAL